MLVSIIITNYNYGNYLHRCIRSCLNQSLPNSEFEVIVVDDSSKDNSDNIVEEYKSLPNFRYIRNRRNLGVAYSANNAIKKSKGKYVVRVDSDDYINKDLANILSFYLEENPKKFGVSCDYYLVNDNEEKIMQVSSVQKPIACGIMYNKKKLLKAGLYNSKFKHREEEELRSRLGDKYLINNLNLPLYRYRMHLSNKTKSKDYIDKYKKKIEKLEKLNFKKKFNTNSFLKNVAVIIPARGGSKRLKNKNIYTFNSKPMIYWSITAAKNTAFKNNVYVSSESKKILRISKKYGAKNILRPESLSRDNTFKIEAIKHAVKEIEKKNKKKLSLVISLQANSPEVRSSDLDKLVGHLIAFNRQEVISVDNHNNSNGAIRVMRRNAVFQKSLSTYLGCVATNITDIHTKNDIIKIYKKNGN
jgi:glycosyltransferase involved in cell wall biosynthesis